MVSVALMATASKQYVSTCVLQGKKYRSAVPLDPLISFRDFSWLFKPSPDLVNYFKNPPMPTREQCRGLGPPFGWDWVIYSLLVTYFFSSTELKQSTILWHNVEDVVLNWQPFEFYWEFSTNLKQLWPSHWPIRASALLHFLSPSVVISFIF